MADDKRQAEQDAFMADYQLFRETVDEMLVEGYLIRPSGAYTALRTTPASTLVAEGRKTVTVKRPPT